MMMLPVEAVGTSHSINTSTDTVTSTALCTCGLEPWGHYYTHTYVDKCPQCGGKLAWNPKGASGGEWTCTRCGADYCAADGRCKAGGSHIYLDRVVVTKKPIVVQPNTTNTPVKDGNYIKQLVNEDWTVF